MTNEEIAAFLTKQADVPAELKAKILAYHAGVCPMWNIGTMLRKDDEIIVIGTWNRQRPRLHVVLSWYWSAEEIGVRWQSSTDAKDATEQSIRIDSPHVVFERSGLRPD